MTHLRVMTFAPLAVRAPFTVTHVPVALASEMVSVPLLAGVSSHRWELAPSQCSISILPLRSAMQRPEDSSDLMAPLLSTRQANFTEPDAPVLSVAVIVTVLYCRLVGVPLITPAGLIDSPRGRPVAL
jgi:hypothetical protein